MSTLRASALLGAASATLLLVACSEAVPPAAEGAYTAKFNDSGPSCQIKGHDDRVGDATVDNFGLLKDGSPGTSVDCIVIDESGTFYAEGTIEGLSGVQQLRFSIPAISPANTVDNPATGSITFKSGETQKAFSNPSETPCTFWFAGSKQQVAAGRLWVSYACDELVSGQSTCGLTGLTDRPNAFAVQNCDQ